MHPPLSGTKAAVPLHGEDDIALLGGPQPLSDTPGGLKPFPARGLLNPASAPAAAPRT